MADPSVSRDRSHVERARVRAHFMRLLRRLAMHRGNSSARERVRDFRRADEDGREVPIWVMPSRIPR